VRWWSACSAAMASARFAAINRIAPVLETHTPKW
jgi:hypothetical protein